MKLSVLVTFLFLNISAGQQKRQTGSIGSRVERFQGILYTVFSRKNAASTTIVKMSLKKKEFAFSPLFSFAQFAKCRRISLIYFDFLLVCCMPSPLWNPVR